GHAAPGGSADAHPPHPDPARRRRGRRAAAARRVPTDQLLHRLAVVRRGRLPRCVHHDPVHADRAVPRGRPAHRWPGGAGDVDRLPLAPGVRPAVRPRGPDRPLPHGDHPARAAVRHRHPGGVRPHRGPVGGGRLAGRPAVRELHAVRPDRPRVRPRHQLLRLPAAVLPAGAELAVRRHRDQLRRRADHPLHLRRDPAHRPQRPGVRGRAGPARDPRRRVRAAQGRRLLARPLRAAVLPAQPAVRRRHVHRPQRGDAGEADPAVHLDHLRRGLLRRRRAAQPAAARDRDRAAGPVQRARRGGVAGGAAAVRRRPQRGAARGAVHRAQHRGHPRRVRDRTGHGHRGRLLRHVRGHAGRGAGRDGHHPEHPHPRPGAAQRDVHPAPAAPHVLRLPGEPRHRPLHRGRRHPPGLRPRAAGAQHLRPGRQPDRLDQPAAGLHPRQRSRGGAGQPGQRRAGRRRRRGRAAQLPEHRHQQLAERVGPGDPARRRAAHVLRRAHRHLLDRRGGRGRAPGGVRLGHPAVHLHRARRRAAGQHRQPAGVRAVLRRAQHPVQQLHQRELEDPLRARPGRPGRAGRAVADPRRRPVPGRGRRAHHLDRRRLHHARPVPLRPEHPARAGHGGHPAGRAAARARPRGQLPAQLGQGHGRRLRRHGDALRVRRGRPGAADLDEDLPGHRATRVGDHREPALAPALPGGPVQGPARADHELPRRQPGRVLLERVVLGGAVGPDPGRRRRRRAGPAAVLPPRRRARRCTVRGTAVPAHQRAGVPEPRHPVGVHVGQLRSGDLRPDHAAAAATGHPGAGPAAGAEPVRGHAGGQSGARPAGPQRPELGDQRQPADPARGGRPALRRTRLHPEGQRGLQLPAAGPCAHELQRPGRFRAGPRGGPRRGLRRRGRCRGADTPGRADATDRAGAGDDAPGGRDRRPRHRGRRVAGAHRGGQRHPHRDRRAAGGQHQRRLRRAGRCPAGPRRRHPALPGGAGGVRRL
ncbi:MAG: putative membrane protein, partial [uncultured Pseudonocardia sp.]